LLHELADTDPDADHLYGGGPNYTPAQYLEYCTVVPSTTAQYWRAEFVQYGDVMGNASGPRVIELDGYDYVIPEPATICLLGTAILLLSRRKK